MAFPPGISSTPGQTTLIARDSPAWVCIHTQGYPDNAAYKINERTAVSAVFPYRHADRDMPQPFWLDLLPDTVVYSGAEHDGTPKLPNITVVRNWPTQRSDGAPVWDWVLGCTMGHWHSPDSCQRRTQELYEFCTPGLLVLDRERGVPEIWVARPGGKVPVPDACHMTLYNLGEPPLITLDFADPRRNPADKALITRRGPILLITYNQSEVTFLLNRSYVNHPPAGVRLTATPGLEARRITIRRTGRMDLGQFLYEQLTGNPEVIGQFARLGLVIRCATPEVRLAPVNGSLDSTLSIARPLSQATAPGSAAYAFFLPEETPRNQPLRAQPDAFVKALASKAATIKRLTRLEKLNRPLVVLVQGVGEWVESAFRPTFARLSEEGYALSVFYADDTSWKGAPPTWTTGLASYEVYLDKASPHDLAVYRNVLARVDVAIIATPDVTHAALAAECVRRRVPTVLIEKPFDSHHANVDALLHALGLHERQRAVLGLDHYMYYVAELSALMPDIQRHLGGALTDVAFYMTEKQPIERGRERSLQYGLMLDMLPHMLALLTYFGAVQTVDDIRVVAAGQYQPLISQDKAGQYPQLGTWYSSETYARVRFTYEDYAGNRVPCLGVIGKGMASEVKYLQVTGSNGNAMRIDLGKWQGEDADYPAGSIFFLASPQHAPGSARPVRDPYDATRTLYILPQPRLQIERQHRYKRLLLDFIQGTDTALTNVLLLQEAYAIVQVLERIWEAIQAAKPHWQSHALYQMGAVQPDTDCAPHT
jgi:predicted dehydrogenase